MDETSALNSRFLRFFQRLLPRISSGHGLSALEVEYEHGEFEYGSRSTVQYDTSIGFGGNDEPIRKSKVILCVIFLEPMRKFENSE